MVNRLAAIALFAILALACQDVQAQTGSDPWFRYSTKPKDFQAAKLPWNTFSIELPKNWQLVPGYDGILLIAVEKTRNNQATAAVVLEQMHLVEPMAMADVDSVLGKLEEDAARTRDPSGQNFQQSDQAGWRSTLRLYSVHAARTERRHRSRCHVRDSSRPDHVSVDLHRAGGSARSKVSGNLCPRGGIVQKAGCELGLGFFVLSDACTPENLISGRLVGHEFRQQLRQRHVSPSDHLFQSVGDGRMRFGAPKILRHPR